MLQFVKVKDNYFHTHTHTHTHIYIYIYIYLSLISYDQPQHDRNFARNLIFANYVTKKSHLKVI